MDDRMNGGKLMRLKIGCVLTVLMVWPLAGAVFAQGEPVADLGVEVVVDPADLFTPPGSRGTLRFTVTNFGPDPAGTPGDFNVTVSSVFPWSPEFGEPVIFRKLAGSPCLLFWGIPDPYPGDPFVIGYEMALPLIQPGDSASCELTFFVNPLAPDIEVPNTWTLFVPDHVDPNPANDTVSFTYKVRVPAIPTLGLFGLLVMVGLLGLVSWKTIGRRRDVVARILKGS